MHPAVPIALVFIGCCSNVVFLELLVKGNSNSGNIVTFAQFLFIALEGFVFYADFGRKSSAIPMNNYFFMVSMFFVVQVVNNMAIGFNISMPLHMIFRAGSLMANMVLGIILLKKRYKLSKYLSVLMISAGIAICTIASAGDVKSHGSSSESAEDKLYEYTRWLIGISMLLFALFMSARMGIFQETMYAKWGKHPKEALFYNHALPLPGFLLLSTDIYSTAVEFNNSEPINVLGIPIPCLWLYLAGNVITQYICIRSVFILTTECQSLTVTLVVTLRKFVSLIFSIMYFKNPFTTNHWMGATLVFGGTLIFTETFTMIWKSLGFGEKKKAD
ncbi:unnamed protein product [Owenia fusiformis]|uniref:Uncharacterized protein n=1 Tax=Owenia fusiformis TaxID=6347 RepID=A0A8J1T6W5_OWEFU|nr:unnamed protein product [Owenia fusiformis]